MSQKARVFIVARKRGVPLADVYALLAKLGLPPTLSQKPEQRGFSPSGAGFEGRAPYSFRLADDRREISREQADEAVAAVMGHR